MYKYKILKNPEYQDDYIYQGRNENNQIIIFEIFRVLDGYFNVKFYITTKRKNGYQFMKQTGTDGIKSLLWAKTCLIKFIEEFTERYHGYMIRIYADDIKRLNVYERGLRDIGFKMSYSKNKYLYYKI